MLRADDLFEHGIAVGLNSSILHMPIEAWNTT